MIIINILGYTIIIVKRKKLPYYDYNDYVHNDRGFYDKETNFHITTIMITFTTIAVSMTKKQILSWTR